MTSSRRIAEETFGWTQLRPEQLAAMEPLAEGRDVLAVLPTGAGKSAIYQVPALLLDGPTVVVSPLIALQRDQREGLAGTDAPDAVVVNSAQRAARDAARAGTSCATARAEFVFLSPEQLANDEIVDALRAARRLAVRGRRGALRLRVGPRLPARLPAAGPGDRAARAPAGGGADRHGRAADARRHRRRGSACATPPRSSPSLRPAEPAPRRAPVPRRRPAPRARSSSGSSSCASAGARGLVYCATRKDAVAYAEQLRARGRPRPRPTTRG